MGPLPIALARQPDRPPRPVNLAVTATHVTFNGARRPGGKLPPVEVSAVYAKEPSPPQGEEPVAWLLLTSLPVTDFLRACTVVQWYRCRWEIELFFRVLKQGCQVEQVRVQTDPRWLNALAIYVIVAWRIHNITMAGRAYPEIRDLVEVDTLASAYLWRYPHLHTCVLRPVNVLGGYVHSMIGQYLKQSRIPTVMGFDPMMQFIHEEDLSEAIALALEHSLQGVFNVTGPGQVPLHTAIRETGGRALPVPEPILRAVFDRAWRWGFQPIPPAALDYLKYPVTVAGERFVEATNFRCLFELGEIFQSVAR